MPAGNDLQTWFKSLPLFTRYWFGGTILFTLVGRFGLINPAYLALLWQSLFQNYYIWTPVTALFYYPLSPRNGFHFLINLYFLYNYSLQLETGLFEGRPADYFFMLLFNWLCCVIVGLVMTIPFLMDPMVLSVLYVWCQLNKDVIVNFWFGTQFKAMYLPWVLFGFNMIIADGGVMELIGILIGHVYFFLMFKYPQEYGGSSFLQTPQILYEWFPNVRGVRGYGQAPAREAAADRPNRGGGFLRGHDWGRGNRLGD